MKKTPLKISLILTFLLGNTYAIDWTANWIWTSDDGPANTWVCFRKKFSLNDAPASAIANIGADSKYWLWINGEPVVFEGGLKRGPTPDDSYYDTVNIAGHLSSGSNTIAILVWFFGKDGFSHKNSGKGGLVFEADIDGYTLVSDNTWKQRIHPGYKQSTGGGQPNFRLSESNVAFDARNGLQGWTLPDYDDNSWEAAAEKGVPPAGPWNKLWPRPIPQWKNSGLVDYTNHASLPPTGDGSLITALLPYNAQVTPYLKINAAAEGQVIDIRTDNYTGGSEVNVRSEYITRTGEQEYESLGWMNGHKVYYTIPRGVEILELKYRETGYATEFTGAFVCDEPFYNILWEKARRTLYVNMRDNFFDCPDRERAQWWGDVVNQLGEIFYVLDTRSHALVKKAISNLVEWQRGDKALFSPVPAGSQADELPTQMLNSIGWYGFWNYYFNTGDTAAIIDAYPHVKDYLSLWSLNADGLVNHREGDWYWADWGVNKDTEILNNCWYYLALKSALNMARLSGNEADTGDYASRMESVEANFNRVFWNGAEYRSPGHSGDPDDRANAMAVITGLADSSKWSGVYSVLQNYSYAGAYMEKYILEALYLMGKDNYALTRMKNRYQEMVYHEHSTLWEDWIIGGAGGGTINHAWNAPNTLLSQYAAGVAPLTTAWDTYSVYPQMGTLDYVSAVVPSVKGEIKVSMAKASDGFSLELLSPSQTSAAFVGIPSRFDNNQNVTGVKVNGTAVWTDGKFDGGIQGLNYEKMNTEYIVFSVKPGEWTFTAGSAPAVDSLPGKVTGTVIGRGDRWNNLPERDYASALDGDISTFSDCINEDTLWVGYDFGRGTRIYGIKYLPRPTLESRMVNGWFEISNDSLSWETIYTITVEPVSGIFTKVELDDTVDTRYIRYCTLAPAFLNVSEIEFLGDHTTNTDRRASRNPLNPSSIKISCNPGKRLCIDVAFNGKHRVSILSPAGRLIKSYIGNSASAYKWNPAAAGVFIVNVSDVKGKRSFAKPVLAIK